MTDLDFDAIRDRRAKAERWYHGVHYGLELYSKSSADVPVLLVEIERLRAELIQVQQNYDEVQADFLIAESVIESLNQQFVKAAKAEDRAVRALDALRRKIAQIARRITKGMPTWDMRVLRDDLVAALDVDSGQNVCSTCKGKRTLKCLAHVTGDGCEDFVIQCPDCPRSVTWAEAAQVAYETFAIQEARRAALAEREGTRYRHQEEDSGTL